MSERQRLERYYSRVTPEQGDKPRHAGGEVPTTPQGRPEHSQIQERPPNNLVERLV
jgi:hypothetical protein